jgi:predicted lipoprotein with Yx(FWY)xxD motif
VRHHGQRAGTVLLSAGLLAAAVAAPALASGHHKGTKITTTHVKLGRVLASSKGRVMYLFAKDGNKVSHCHGACATAWPKVTSEAKPVAGAGISAKHLSRTSKHDQVTYYGHPLYYFSGDTKPGKDTGENLNSFFVVSTHGKPIKPPKKTKPTGPSGPAEVTTGTVDTSTEVITNSKGRTLYELSSESSSPVTVYCTAGCATVWLPLLTKGAPTASGDAMGSLLGTAKRPDGSTQVTYNGYLVYTYTGDTAAGQDNGQYVYAAGLGPGLPYWRGILPNGTPNPATTP